MQDVALEVFGEQIDGSDRDRRVADGELAHRAVAARAVAGEIG
jgi:hypothetical protein